MSGNLSSAGFLLPCEILLKNNHVNQINNRCCCSISIPIRWCSFCWSIESNISYPDGDYSGATTDLQIGYEGSLSETADFYVQGGPAFIAVDGTDGSETEFAGKFGVTVAATDTLGVYGELSGITDEVASEDVINWGAKIGAKFSF